MNTSSSQTGLGLACLRHHCQPRARHTSKAQQKALSGNMRAIVNCVPVAGFPALQLSQYVCAATSCTFWFFSLNPNLITIPPGWTNDPSKILRYTGWRHGPGYQRRDANDLDCYEYIKKNMCIADPRPLLVQDGPNYSLIFEGNHGILYFWSGFVYISRTILYNDKEVETMIKAAVERCLEKMLDRRLGWRYLLDMNKVIGRRESV